MRASLERSSLGNSGASAPRCSSLEAAADEAGARGVWSRPGFLVPRGAVSIFKPQLSGLCLVDLGAGVESAF